MTKQCYSCGGACGGGFSGKPCQLENVATDALIQDAARYRWLRDNCHPIDSNREEVHALIRICRGSFQGGIGWFNLIGPESRVGVISLDAAVDTARTVSRGDA